MSDRDLLMRHLSAEEQYELLVKIITTPKREAYSVGEFEIIRVLLFIARLLIEAQEAADG